MVILLGGVLLVDSDDQLLDTEGVGEQGVLSGPQISLKLSRSGGDDEHTTVSLAGAMPCHEVTVARGVDNGHVVLGGLKFPESNVNGDT